MKKQSFVYLIAVIIMICSLTGCELETNSNEHSDNSNNTTSSVTTEESTVVTKAFQYNDGFMVVTYDDLDVLKENDDFTDVYVIGTVKEIDKVNNIRIVDSVGGEWTADVGTDRDFSSYIGTQCEIYGFSSGGISSQHNTPLINMNHNNNKIIFSDGKELYPEDYESTQQFNRKNFENNSNIGVGNVWIPTDGGTKYHSKKTCSGMENPIQTSEKEAAEQGFTKCGKCW